MYPSPSHKPIKFHYLDIDRELINICLCLLYVDAYIILLQRSVQSNF